ncbi:hypothetical protein MASR1M42_20950 [Azonexus hydrophilus]
MEQKHWRRRRVSVVSGDTHAASGAIRFTEALSAKVPGLYMRAGSEPIAPEYRAHCFAAWSITNRVKFMLDGINLSDGNAGTLSSLLGVNLDDVERIEVVPGVSSALYGSDAIGGVVNIISKMPTKQESTVSTGAASPTAIAKRTKQAFVTAGTTASPFLSALARRKWAVMTRMICRTAGRHDGQRIECRSGRNRHDHRKGEPAYIVGDRGATTAEARYINGKILCTRCPVEVLARILTLRSEMGYQGFNSYLTKNGVPLTLPANNVSINGDN